MKHPSSMTPEELQEQFIASGGERPKVSKRERRRLERGSTAKRKKRVRTVSTKQLERTAFLHGIKAERLRAIAVQRVEMSDDQWPPYRCEGGCGATYATIEEAWAALTVSHIESRNDTASRYERRREPEFRGDDPSNIAIECKSCNGKREPQPEWSTA